MSGGRGDLVPVESRGRRSTCRGCHGGLPTSLGAGGAGFNSLCCLLLLLFSLSIHSAQGYAEEHSPPSCTTPSGPLGPLATRLPSPKALPTVTSSGALSQSLPNSHASAQTRAAPFRLHTSRSRTSRRPVSGGRPCTGPRCLPLIPEQAGRRNTALPTPGLGGHLVVHLGWVEGGREDAGPVWVPDPLTRALASSS